MMEPGQTRDSLVRFLYILMRDHLPSGVVEDIMENHVEKEKHEWTRLTNGFLAGHAYDLASRLKQTPSQA